MKWQRPDDSFYCVSCGDPATISDHITPVRPDDREGVLREAIESMCRPCPSANTVTGAHVDGTPATVEGAQTPVMSLHEELTAQLGGFSGTVVAVPWISSRDLAAQRTSHQKIAQVFVGADGHVNSIRIGARGSSASTGTFLRVYDKPLPAFADQTRTKRLERPCRTRAEWVRGLGRGVVPIRQAALRAIGQSGSPAVTSPARAGARIWEGAQPGTG